MVMKIGGLLRAVLLLLLLQVHLLKAQSCNPNIGTITMPAQSCRHIKEMNGDSQNGIFYLRDAENSVFPTYCDMKTSGGGWTLVASVHENSLTGKCTTGDRWSSEQGNRADHPHGDGNWENRATFGRPESASSDDYKNSAYFNMIGRDIMIWHVPNNTPLNLYENKAFLKYHTETGFLALYGNLQRLFADYYNLRDNTFDNHGPSEPIVWDKGDNSQMVLYTPQDVRDEIEPGFIQFRAINDEKSAFALCPGVKFTTTRGNVEHACVGGTSFHDGHANIHKYCGDFAAKDWDDHSGTATMSSAPKEIIESVIMIFYR